MTRLPISSTASTITFTNATRRRAVLRLMTASALAVSAGLSLTACAPEKLQFKSVDLTGADYAKGFSLNDHNGAQRSLSDFAGKVVVVFFGFTQCPDVCPTAMVELAEVKKQLGAGGEKLQVVFMTVDPERDTPDVLKAYMTNFDPTFVALRPTPDQLVQVAKDFKVFYKKVEGKAPGTYSMDHTAGSYVFDGKGQIRLFTRYGSPVADLVTDIRLLQKSA